MEKELDIVQKFDEAECVEIIEALTSSQDMPQALKQLFEIRLQTED